jgi:IS30 family transposase
MAMHLTALEREQVAIWLQMRVSKAEIARRLGRHPCTIFRELKRNSVYDRYSDRRSYRAIAAQELSGQRRHQPRTRKLQQPEIRRCVLHWLGKYWSPDQIAGRMRREIADRRLRVSHQTIYDWIKSDDHGRLFRPFLRRSGMRRRPRRSARAVAAIANRPEVIARRERVGDWEGDTIVGAHRSGALVSLVERRTGFTVLAKVDRLASAPVEQAIRRRLQPLPESRRRSITFDNGLEFSRHGRLSKALGIAVYFAQPHSPWQRGINEHTNGLVRQFLPKGSCFRELTHAAVARLQSLLNGRPRKGLGYLTPKEAFEDASHAMLS